MTAHSDHDHRPPNRLAGESSPYLLLHQYNPVDWYPWGEEALARAREEDKPIFLSVGYSTCYWCHVMERESFADPQTAALMNQEFVNVKLDREERPDLDEIYMAATQILTHQGGWPNSLFLTPELRPFYAGTYFPPDDRHGRPGFRGVLYSLAEAWKNRRADVEDQAEEMERAMRHFLEERSQPAPQPPQPDIAARAAASLERQFDAEWGGFGDAPKFPSPSNLFLLQELADENPEAGRMLAATLDAMARGGIYDQLAGGFHRYATDREWKIPHFEKMLYDNGLLLELYAREHDRTGDPEMARIARETARFLARELTSPEGAFWSAIDAETHGHEGAYHVWSPAGLERALGREDAAFLAPLLGFAGPPFFEGKGYVLHLPRPLAEVAAERRMSYEELLGEIQALEARLLTAREDREHPATDDKVLTEWNGMAISGLAVAGELLREPGLVAQAARAADFLLRELRPEGVLLHTWRVGQAKIPAFLNDYAFLVRGLLALHRATGEARWLDSAVELTREQKERLRDPQGGYFVAGESPDVLFRSKEVFDGATPAGNAVAALNLLELAERTGEDEWRTEARATLAAFAPLANRHPEAVRMLAIANRRYYRLSGEEPAAAAPDEPSQSAALADLARRQLRVGIALEGDRFRLRLAIAPGWHVNANPASEPFLIPTEVHGEGVEVTDLRYPPAEDLATGFTETRIAVYRGEVEITGRLEGHPARGQLVLAAQLCDEQRCLPPLEWVVGLSGTAR